MHITIIAVGKLKEKYLQTGVAEYSKRLTPFCKLKIIEVSEEKMPDNPSPAEKAAVLAREDERVLKQVPRDSYLIALDVQGKLLSSEGLAARLADLALNGRSDLSFVIGGAFGLSAQLTAAAAERLSFSPLTFTHQMIRLLLVEQIYRAFKINAGEPYHW